MIFCRDPAKSRACVVWLRLDIIFGPSVASALRYVILDLVNTPYVGAVTTLRTLADRIVRILAFQLDDVARSETFRLSDLGACNHVVGGETAGRDLWGNGNLTFLAFVFLPDTTRHAATGGFIL